MPLTEFEKSNLFRFIGYGNIHAPIWFLGMEEAGGGEDRLRIRASFDRVESLREAQTRLGYGFHFEGRKKIQSTWQWMIYTLLRLHGVETITAVEKRAYQAEWFGRRDGPSLIAELMPIPKPTLDAFDYPESFPELSTADELYAHLIERRVAMYRDLLTEHRPRVVIAYGKSFWSYYDQVFDVDTWAGDSTIRYGMSQQILVIEAPHLISRALNGRRSEFADLIQKRCPNLSPLPMHLGVVPTGVKESLVVRDSVS